jgi:hypothetical protein
MCQYNMLRMSGAGPAVVGTVNHYKMAILD